MPVDPRKPQAEDEDAGMAETLPYRSGPTSVTTLHTTSCRDGPRYAPQDYAGFFRRTAALLIDGFLFISLVFSIAVLWAMLDPASLATDEAIALFGFGATLLFMCYNLGLRMTTGGTLGYRMVGIRYAYALGGRAPWYLTVYRSFIAVFLLWTFSLDHLWIAFDKNKQAWHDKLSGFYVVKRRAQPCGTRRIVRRVINFMMLSFVVWEPADDEAPVARPAAPSADDG